MVIDNFGLSTLFELAVSGRMRKVIRLHYVNKFTDKEIAEQMGYPESVIVSELVVVEQIIKKELKAKKCDKCGKPFYTSNKKISVCPMCIEENRKIVQNAKENKKETKQPTTKIKKKNPKSIYEILRDKDEYNKANGTNLSYGKYVLLKGE